MRISTVSRPGAIYDARAEDRTSDIIAEFRDESVDFGGNPTDVVSDSLSKSYDSLEEADPRTYRV